MELCCSEDLRIGRDDLRGDIAVWRLTEKVNLCTAKGLDYAKISRTLDNKVYGPGYHYLGFAHKFITYPSTVINMEFSDSESADRPAIESRTDDGLTIKFKASF